jgi:hypothetical protein
MLEMWLDDNRKPSEFHNPSMVWVKTAEEAIKLLQTGKVTYASLDHDLGEGKSGYDVVCWMEEHNIWPVDGVDVHSMNPVGRKNMQVVIDKAYAERRNMPRIFEFVKPGKNRYLCEDTIHGWTIFLEKPAYLLILGGGYHVTAEEWVRQVPPRSTNE